MAKRITRCALFSALLCLISPICIPIGPVPVSLSLLAVMLMALLLPLGEALTCVGVYLALGSLGLPVFAGFGGGIGMLFGATGGFIFSYLFVVLCIVALHKTGKYGSHMGCVLGLLVSYVCGLLWYCYVAAPVSFLTAVMVCVVPFIPFDILKILLAVWLSNRMKARIKK